METPGPSPHEIAPQPPVGAERVVARPSDAVRAKLRAADEVLNKLGDFSEPAPTEVIETQSGLTDTQPLPAVEATHPETATEEGVAIRGLRRIAQKLSPRAQLRERLGGSRAIHMRAAQGIAKVEEKPWGTHLVWNKEDKKWEDKPLGPKRSHPKVNPSELLPTNPLERAQKINRDRRVRKLERKLVTQHRQRAVWGNDIGDEDAFLKRTKSHKKGLFRKRGNRAEDTNPDNGPAVERRGYFGKRGARGAQEKFARRQRSLDRMVRRFEKQAEGRGLVNRALGVKPATPSGEGEQRATWEDLDAQQQLAFTKDFLSTEGVVLGDLLTGTLPLGKKKKIEDALKEHGVSLENIASVINEQGLYTAPAPAPERMEIDPGLERRLRSLDIPESLTDYEEVQKIKHTAQVRAAAQAKSQDVSAEQMRALEAHYTNLIVASRLGIEQRNLDTAAAVNPVLRQALSVFRELYLAEPDKS